MKVLNATELYTFVKIVNFICLCYVVCMFCHIFKISEKNTDDPMCPEEEKETRE